MKKYKPYLGRVDLVKNQVAREELKEQEAKRKRSARLQQQNRQRWLKYQEQLRSELAARYFHGVVSAGGESFSNKFSVAFDGVSDSVDIGSPTSIQSLTSEITISAWIKAPKTFLTNQYTLASKGEYAAVGSQWTIQIYTANASNNNGGYFQIFPQSDGLTDRQTLSFPTAIDDNQWHHLMCVNDGTDLKIYLDGQLEATGAGKGRTLYNGNKTLRLGRLTGSTINELIGNLDEVAIFGTALGLSDAEAIYNDGEPGDLTSLNPVSWWRFEEGSGSIAKDSGSGGNDGTLVNDVAFEEDVPGS